MKTQGWTMAIAAMVLFGLTAAVQAASTQEPPKQGLSWNDTKSMYNIGKASFDVTKQAIGVAGQANPLLTAYSFGKVAYGCGQGLAQGTTYSNWQRPQVVSAGEGARTVCYTTAVLARRATEAAASAVRRR